MPTFIVPVKVVVPAPGEVEVEAASLQEAFAKVRASIKAGEFYDIAGEVEFFANWNEASSLSVADEEAHDESNSRESDK